MHYPHELVLTCQSGSNGVPQTYARLSSERDGSDALVHDDSGDTRASCVVLQEYGQETMGRALGNALRMA